MVPKAKEILFSRKKFTISRKKCIQDLKAIYQNMCKKAYHIYLIYDQFVWYSLLLTPSNCLIHPLLSKFEPICEMQPTVLIVLISRSVTSSSETCEQFVYYSGENETVI